MKTLIAIIGLFLLISFIATGKNMIFILLPMQQFGNTTFDGMQRFDQCQIEEESDDRIFVQEVILMTCNSLNKYEIAIINDKTYNVVATRKMSIPKQQSLLLCMSIITS